MWRIKENLIIWDTAFALSFTSYNGFVVYVKKHHDTPIDPVREILIRLYMLEPEFPRLFVAPSITQFVDFLFNLDSKKAGREAMRPKCMSLLAPLLGRNRTAGYRWLRNSEHSDNPVQLEIRRLISKVFSMEPKYARQDFWRAALATAKARSQDVEQILATLKDCGVEVTGV